MYHREDVPKLGTYGASVARCHRLIPQLTALLGQLLVPAKIQFIDLAKLPACSNHRTGRYQVAKKQAGMGRSWQGYWYGFKLHLAINGQGQISALAFTPADVYDGHATQQCKRSKVEAINCCKNRTKYPGLPMAVRGICSVGLVTAAVVEVASAVRHRPPPGCCRLRSGPPPGPLSGRRQPRGGRLRLGVKRSGR